MISNLLLPVHQSFLSLFRMLSLTLMLVIVLSHHSGGLIIHIATSNSSNYSYNQTSISDNTNNTTLKSTYSTLGNHTTTSPILSPLFLLSPSGIDNIHCSCEGNLSGRVVVLDGDLPYLIGCSKDIVGRIAALVKILERKGADAVILPAQEEVCNLHRSYSTLTSPYYL